MSDSSTSPSPDGNSKKGLSPIAWVGIGCGGLVVLGFIVIVAGGMFIGSKVKEGIEQVNDNPERFAAEMIVKVNPDMEMVEANDEEGKMTIKMKKTGEELTFSYADIKEGKFTVKTSKGGTINVDGKSNQIVAKDADGKTTVMKNDGKTLKIEGSDGKTTITMAGKGGQYWDHLPAGLKDFAYPNVSEEGSPMSTIEKNNTTTTSFMFLTADADAAVKKFYQDKFKAGGYTIEEQDSPLGIALQGSKGKDVIKIKTIDRGDGKIMVMFFGEQGK